MKKITIYVVDDMPDVLESMEIQLSSLLPCDVETFTSFNLVIEKLNAGEAPDLIISDINMPDGHGEAWGDALTKQGLKAPIIYYTGFDEDEQQEDGPVILAKPIDSAHLLEEIKKATS